MLTEGEVKNGGRQVGRWANLYEKRLLASLLYLTGQCTAAEAQAVGEHKSIEEVKKQAARHTEAALRLLKETKCD